MEDSTKWRGIHPAIFITFWDLSMINDSGESLLAFDIEHAQSDTFTIFNLPIIDLQTIRKK